MVPPVPQYLNWSEEAITWDRNDHPELMPNPGGYALVLEPMLISTKRACTFSRVLIDGGSSINILYRDTLGKFIYEVLCCTRCHLKWLRSP